MERMGEVNCRSYVFIIFLFGLCICVPFAVLCMDLVYGYGFIIDIYLLLATHKRIVLAIQPVYFLPVSLRSLCVCFCLVDEFK